MIHFPDAMYPKHASTCLLEEVHQLDDTITMLFLALQT